MAEFIQWNQPKPLTAMFFWGVPYAAIIHEGSNQRQPDRWTDRSLSSFDTSTVFQAKLGDQAIEPAFRETMLELAEVFDAETPGRSGNLRRSLRIFFIRGHFDPDT